jgi:hypothetical protein
VIEIHVKESDWDKIIVSHTYNSWTFPSYVKWQLGEQIHFMQDGKLAATAEICGGTRSGGCKACGPSQYRLTWNTRTCTDWR